MISALRRYWWLVVALTALGGVAANAAITPEAAYFESRGQLLVTPALNSGASSFDADRYIASELERLGSVAMAERVAEDLGVASDPALIAEAVSFEQSAGANVVTVFARAATPEEAREIANSYLRVYLQIAQEQLDLASTPTLEGLRNQELALRSELAAVDAQIEEVMRKYVDAASAPSIQIVNPALASQRDLLINDYTAIRSEIRRAQSTGPKLSSEIVQAASLPSAPITSSNTKYVVLGVIVGGFVGFALAILLGRLSRRVLDKRQIEEAVGHPIAASMPPDANVTKHRERALKDPPKSQWRFANTLCVRAESHRSAGESLTVLVTSSANGAGSTTIAAAVARRFAAAGLDVLLIDADPNMPELSSVYAVNDSEQGSLASLATTPLGGSDPDGSRDARTPTRSRVSGLSVVGIGSADDITLLRRLDPRDLLSRAGRLADVVVVDGGSLLESGSTVQLMQVVDAVILAVPLRWQDAKELTTLSLQLRSRSDGILTVLSPVSRSAARRSRARGLRYRPAEPRTNEPVGSGAGFPTPDATHPILHSSGRAAGPVPPKQDESRPSRLGSRRRRGASQKQISESAPTTTNGVPTAPGNDLAYAPLAREAAASPQPTPPDPVSPR